MLDECANHPQAFANPECVFSYELSRDKDCSGVFKYYIEGLQKRQQAIANACEACPNGVVRYTDIKRFYPSIETDLALRAWQKQCYFGGIPKRYCDLGEKLITEHSRAGNSDQSAILTGPMFSHLLGNLVLRELDEACSQKLPARYFRYVDDITLVGEADAVAKSLKIVRGRLSDLGLSLHGDSSPKNIEVPAGEWLKSRNDFRESHRTISWKTLIGDLKKFLLVKPEERKELQEAFRREGFRIPVRDYTSAVHESSYLERALQLAMQPWFRRKGQAITIQTLVIQAKWLRASYENEFRHMLDGAAGLERFDRKRLTPKLRYRAGRLIYLATDDTLASLSSVAGELPELYFHAKVMAAVATGNIDQVLSLGTNAAQAAAQPLRAVGRRAITTLLELPEAEEQTLAVFLLNGVPVDRPNPMPEGESELLRFATSGVVDLSLMKSSDPFMREIACLHGLSQQPRHPALLETAFDEDEGLAMDAIDQLQQSLSP